MKNHGSTSTPRCYASPLVAAVAATLLTAFASGCQNSSGTVAVREQMGGSVTDSTRDPLDRLEQIVPEQQKCVTKGEHGVRENFACYVIARRGGADGGTRIAYTADPEATIPAVVETLRAALGEVTVEVKKVTADEYHALQARFR